MSKDKLTKFNMHALKNLMGSKTRDKQFANQHEEFSREYGIKITRSINRFGADLSDIEMRVLEGILSAFTKTNYQGNTSPKTVEEEARDKFSGNLPESYYKNIASIPRVRIKRSELLQSLGIMDCGRGSDNDRAIAALSNLGSKQYCFYYDRLQTDAKGKPIKDEEGNFLKESVTVVDTLFVLKEVRDTKTKRLRFYEITPSPIFLDQVDNYFVFIPEDWRVEVQKLFGKRKTSSYTFNFLIYLRYLYEQSRRASTKTSLVVRLSPVSVAIGINMPQSVYERKKSRRDKILEDAYDVAVKLGYLEKYERLEDVDVFTFAQEKYYNPKLNTKISTQKIEQVIEEDGLDQVDSILDLFVRKKRVLDRQFRLPDGEKCRKAIQDLLKQRSFEEIEKVINWGLGKKYWSTRLGSVQKLKKNFSEALTEMNIEEGPLLWTEINRQLAEAIARAFKDPTKRLQLNAISTGLEFCDVAGQPEYVAYNLTENEFEKKVVQLFNKRKFKVDLSKIKKNIGQKVQTSC